MQAPQRLERGARIRVLLADPGQQGRQQGRPDPVADRGRQVGHRVRVGFEPAVVLPGELVGAERRQAEIGDGSAQRGRRQVGQVGRRYATPRGVENQGQGGHGRSSVPESAAGRTHGVSMSGPDPSTITSTRCCGCSRAM